MNRLIIENLHNAYWQVLDLSVRSKNLGNKKDEIEFRIVARNIADLLERKAGFDPNQPRVPAGNSRGGEWTDDSRWAGVPIGDFESYDSVIGNDLPRVDILEEQRIESGNNTRARIFKKESSVPDENGNKVKVVNIFIGGREDDKLGNVRNSRSLKETVGENYYATENMKSEVKDFINKVPDDYEINVIGHSYGADTATEIVEELPEDSVDNLVTVDGVSTFSTPDFKKVKKKVKDSWINIDSVEGEGRGSSGGNIVADVFGDWDEEPASEADIYIEAEKIHEDFDGMMRTSDSSGRSPQEMLNGKKKTMEELLDEIYQDSNNDFYDPNL